ncbi:MAG: right-handed parallel beta-helix repeat-containing protein, partial [Candidatus Thermoplasmatota archaeon]
MRLTRTAAALALIAWAALVLAAGPAASTSNPIRITSDSELASQASHGAGTPGDPFIIENVSISASASAAHGIDISNTQATLILRNVYVASGGGSFDGIRLVNVRNVTIEGATLENDRHGIVIQSSRDVSVANTSAKSSRVGILLVDSTNVTLRDDRLSVNDQDVHLTRSAGNTLLNNNLSIATGQFGVFFDDVASYDNQADTTNLVNGVPLQWSANAVGVTLAPPVMDLRGITNVAQVLLYNASGVTVSNAVAKSSATGAAGIACVRCANVTFTDPTLEANGGPGLLVQSSSNVTITGATALANAGSGMVADSSANVTITGASLRSNTGRGVAFTMTPDAHIFSSVVRSNVGEGVLALTSPRARIENSTLTTNGGVDVSLRSAPGSVVRANAFMSATATAVWLTGSDAAIDANTLSGHTTGVRLTSATGSVVTGNTLTLTAGQTAFSFDAQDAYDNAIDASNLVNGVPVRWFTNVRGTTSAPITLPTVTVDVPGITNVAQVMLYKCANVTLPAAVARNGTGIGILLQQSERVNVTTPTVSDNGGNGIALVRSTLVGVSGGDVRSNGGHGFLASDSPSALLQNNVIQNNRGRGVSIETSELATLRGNGVVSNVRAGIFVLHSGPGPVVIENNLLQGNTAGGLFSDASTIGSIRNNRMDANSDTGIQLTNTALGTVLSANSITDHLRNLRLTNTQGIVADNNTIVMRTGQFGVWFDDEASYNNTLPPTNTVNGVPLRWYVALDGTTITDVDVELQGITNVAQVMLYRSTNVTVANLTLANGTARSLYVDGGANITVRNATISGGSLHGVHAQATSGFHLDNATIARAGGRGILAGASAGPWLSNVTVLDSAAEGINIGRSATRVLIEDVTARRNQGGIVLETTLATVRRSTIDSNGAVGLAIHASAAGSVIDGNAFVNQTRDVQLSLATATNYTNNSITLASGQTAFHFADETSYDNNVSESNLVNGAPMRWYSRVRDVVLWNLTAETPGMTNVAQITVFLGVNVTIENATVANGVARGILVTQGGAVVINGSTVRNVTLSGIEARLVSALGVTNTTIRDARGSGIEAVDNGQITIRSVTVLNASRDGLNVLHGSTNIQNSTFRLNARHGVDLISVENPRVIGNDIESNAARGIQVDTPTGIANVSENTVSANGGDGIAIERASSARVLNNTVASNAASGILLNQLGAGTLVDGNVLANNLNGVRLIATEYALVNNTHIFILSGQTGFRFDDERSFDNVLPLTNTVNGIALRWYTMLSGTQSDPIVIPDVDVELRGITNVAQTMIYRSAYVRVPNATATNGTNRGIYVYRSSNVIIDGANVSGNTRYGVHLHATQSSDVTNLTAEGTLNGVFLSSSVSNAIDHVLAPGAQTGVAIGDVDSRGNVIHDVDTTGAGHVGVTDPTASALRGANLVADAGSERHAKVGVPVSFPDGLASARFDSERITQQSWDFGDGQSVSSSAPSVLRPTHTYTQAGTMRATLTVLTADGQMLTDGVNVIVVPPLSAPRDVVVTSGDRNATLAWQAPGNDGGLPILKYRVYRGPTAGSLAQVAEVGNVTSYLDASDLVNGQDYSYAVTALTGDGEGPRSAIASVVPATTPGAPTRLSARGGAANVTLDWQAPADRGGLPITSYRVYRGPDAGNLTLLATLDNVLTYLDTGLVNGQSYQYAIDVSNALGHGPRTTSVGATPLAFPSVPSNLTLLAGDTRVTLLWGAPNDSGGLPILGYRVFRGAAEGALVPLLDLANVTQHVDSGLVNDRSYAYAVAAFNRLGQGNLTPVRAVVPTSIDTLPPVFLLREPMDGSHTGDPRVGVSARFVDNVGVVPAAVRLLVDGVNVTANASVGAMSAVWLPPEDLAPGNHTVRLTVRDA